MVLEENVAPSLHTDRLVLTEVDEPDIEEMLSIRLADTERLQRTEGPGGYDRATFERDLMVAQMDPERILFAIRRQIDERAVGLADVLRHNPEDGFFWIGAIEIDPSARGQGFGREVTEELVEWAAGLEQPRVRCVVDEDDEHARGFVEAFGFRTVDVSERHGPSGSVSIHVYEHALHAHD